MHINTKKIKESIYKKGYFIVKDIGKENILTFANNFWIILDQTWRKDYFINIKPTNLYNKKHPQKWTDFLDLHIDWFFKKLDIRPDYIILYCINPGKWWEILLCNLNIVFENIINKYWKEIYKNICNLKCFWNKNIFTIWNSHNKIYQDIKYNYYQWLLISQYNNKKYYSLSDNFKWNRYLEILKDEIDKNVFCIENLEKWDLIIINNFSYLHWRKKILSNTRSLIRLHIKEKT